MRTLCLVVLAVSTLLIGACAAEPTDPVVPPGEPAMDCRAPLATCQGVIGDARANAPRGAVPLAIRVVCAPGCTIQNGSAEVDIRYSDGSTEQYGMSWSGPLPGEGIGLEPTLPVGPTCEGVPEPNCSEMALSAFTGALGGPVATILVRCTVAACTPTAGEGQTVITYLDGGTETSTFGYSSSGG